MHSSIGATDMRCESITPLLSHRVDATGWWGCDLLGEAPSSVATIALRPESVFQECRQQLKRESLDRVLWVVLIRARVNRNSRGYVVWDFGLTTKVSETHFKVAPVNGGSRHIEIACLFLRYYSRSLIFSRVSSQTRPLAAVHHS